MSFDPSSGLEPASLAMPVSDRDHVFGPANAPVTLVEYGDYECPACGQIYPTVKALLETAGRDVRFVFRHFPLSNMHPHASHAAQASEFAGAGDRFWEMHDLLYENQTALRDLQLAQYAAELGLDGRALLRDLQEEHFAPRVREDFMSGIRSGVNGTPTFFINGLRYDGNYNLRSFLAALEAANTKAPRKSARSPGRR